MITDADNDYLGTIAHVCGGIDATRNTLALAKICLAEGVHGDFVECGVCAGTHPAVMAYAISCYGGTDDRKVHLFDSFEQGFTEEKVNSIDDVYRYSVEELSRCVSSARDPVMTSVVQVEANMRAWNVDTSRLVYHQGWLQEVLPRLEAVEIALLRIDVDLFSPNYSVFRFLYDRVVSGGFVISDDWGDDAEAGGGRLAALRFFSERGLPLPQVTRVCSGTVWWRKS